MATHRIIAASCAAALLFLAGSVATVEAQTRGQGRTPSTPGSSGSPGAVILYGSPGNCPPTIACGNQRTRRLIHEGSCDRWEYVRTATGERVRRCMDR